MRAMARCPEALRCEGPREAEADAQLGVASFMAREQPLASQQQAGAPSIECPIVGPLDSDNAYACPTAWDALSRGDLEHSDLLDAVSKITTTQNA